jgi:hypothetical protein
MQMENLDTGYNKCYYGSTINGLSRRLAHHRLNYNAYKNNQYGYVSVFGLFDEYGMENCKIELVESCPCRSREEVLKQEGLYIKNNSSVNTCITGRADKQSHYKAYIKEYHETHKDKIKEYKQAYYANYKQTLEQHVCEICGGTYKDNKNRHERTNKHITALNHLDDV